MPNSPGSRRKRGSGINAVGGCEHRRLGGRIEAMGGGGHLLFGWWRQSATIARPLAVCVYVCMTHREWERERFFFSQTLIILIVFALNSFSTSIMHLL